MQPLTQAVLKLQKRDSSSYDGHLIVSSILFLGVGGGLLLPGLARQQDKFILIPIGIALLVAGIAAAVGFVRAEVNRNRALDSIRQEFHKFLAERGVELSNQAWRDLNIPKELPKTSKILGATEGLHRGKLTNVVLKYDASSLTDGTFVLLSADGEPLRELTPVPA